MRKRFLALAALLTLGLMPAFAQAEEVVPAPGTGALIAKAYGPVVEVGETSLVIEVQDAYEWVDGSEVKNPAPALVGQRIVVNVIDKSIIRRGDTAVGLAGVKVGDKMKAIMTPDAQPATPTSVFTLCEGYIEVPKVHPGDKFESAFFHRLWHTRGAILGLETVEGRNIMNLDVRRLENAPKRFKDEGVRLVNMDAFVIVPARVVITDVDGDRIAFADLNVDDRVKVVTKMLPKSKWINDEAGEPTPTLLAKRIKVKARG